MSGPGSQLRPISRAEVMGWAAAASLAAVALVPLTAAWRLAQDLGHGWALPLLAGYLWWERWDERPGGIARERVRARWWVLAAVLGLLALAFRLPLTPFPLWPVPLWGYIAVLMAVALGGAWLAAGGAGMRWVGGPLLLVFGALPWPTAVELKLVGPMRERLAAATAEVCYLFGISAQAVGTTVRMPHAWVGVDETCGGMRSLQACVMAAFFFGEWLRLAWPRRVLLVAVGLGAAVAGNFLRILLLVWRASIGGEPALAAAHDLAGWIALGTSLGLTGLVAWLMRGPSPTATKVPGSKPARGILPRAALTWMASLAVGLVVIEGATRWWYWRGARPPEVAAVAEWRVRFPQSSADFRPAPLSEVAREMLRPDFFVAGDWLDARQRPVSAYYIEWHAKQEAHNPMACLTGAGCELVRATGLLKVRWAGGELPFQTFVFRREGAEFMVGFVIWDPVFGRALDDEYGGFTRLVAARLRQVREGRTAEPAQLLTVAVWGEPSREEFAALIEQLVMTDR